MQTSIAQRHKEFGTDSYLLELQILQDIVFWDWTEVEILALKRARHLRYKPHICLGQVGFSTEGPQKATER